MLYLSLMKFEDIVKRANEIRVKYDTLNALKNGKPWDQQARMAGFVADVGELSEIIMAKHGLRDMEDVDTKLAHELSDCLWSVLVLASGYGVDLESEFMKTMDQLDTRIEVALGSNHN